MLLAYNSTQLDRLRIADEVEAAVKKGLVSRDEEKAIADAHPLQLYAPNFFIRIGLFVITLLSALLATGFMILLVYTSGSEGMATVFLLAAVGAYLACELFVHYKHHYKSGVDTALMWLTGGMLIAFYIAMDFSGNDSALSLYVMVIAVWMAIRFADVPMTVVAYLSFLYFIFYYVTGFSAAMRYVMPFLVAGISLGVYFISRAMAARENLRQYYNCFAILEIVSLVTLYCSLNYFIVREISNEMFGLQLAPGQSIPLGWLFWIFTIALPIVYIAIGLRKKDRILIGSGLLLVAAAVYTFRYYHTLLPLETAMVLAGAFLMMLAWGVMRYLHPPKHGFTTKEDDEKGAIGKLHLESLVITQTMGRSSEVPQETKGFGGGSGIGGGASGDY